MKNKKYNLKSGKILLLLLGVFSTFLSHSQTYTPRFIKGLTLPVTIAGDPEARLITDYSIEIQYATCYNKSNIITYSTDSTGWSTLNKINMDPNNIFLGFVNFTGNQNIENGLNNDSESFNPLFIQRVPELKNFFSDNGVLMKLPGNTPINPQRTGGIQENDNEDINNFHQNFFVKTNGDPWGYRANAGDYKLKTINAAMGCGDITMKIRFFNTVLQFRSKPTPQNQNPPLLPYYCNGGGSVPTFAGGHISFPSGGTGGGGGGVSTGYAGSSVIRNLCGCGGPALGGPVDPNAPVDTVCAPGEFNQKIDADWPGANEDYMHILCDLSVERNGIEVYKGVTSSEGHFKVFKVKANDKIVLRSTKEMNGFAKGSFILTAPQPTPIKINLSPNFVSTPPDLD